MPTLDLAADPPLEAWPVDGRVAVLDLEYTAWDGSAVRNWQEAWEWREIVEIGCVVADAGDDFAIVAEFAALVRPLRNPVLSDYFIQLTGIEQSRLDRDAVSLAAAADDLIALCATSDRIIFNGTDGEVLRENCVMQDIDLPWPVERMFNFRPLLAQTLDRPAGELISSDLPAIAGIEFNGPAHTALHDCRAITSAFAAWRQQGRL